MDQKPFQSKVLWDKSSGVQPSSRQPKPKPHSSQATNHQATGTSTEVSRKINIENSILKPDAPEFIPAMYRVPHNNDQENYFPQNVHITVSDGRRIQKQSAQDRLKKWKNPSESSSCYPESSPNLSNGYYDHDESTDMIRLKQIISSLIKYPGQFDDLLLVFMETIYPYFDDILAMSEIAQLLVGEAINSPNFRYNGVRLCWYVEQKCPEFRAELHLRCQKDLHENPNQQNVVLFIAELYTQLPHDSLYGSLLLDSLKKLLNIGGNDNVKCVCQALKLTGYSLEGNHKQALDDLFAQLRAVRSTLSGSALMLLNSVINLRESNWGRGGVESSNASDSSEYDQDYEEMVNGILYETEGQTLTNEEHEFLMANSTNDEYIMDNEDPDALCDPEPEMDEEIQAAFEEFVKLSKG